MSDATAQSVQFRRLTSDDAEALCAFYNGLSDISKRTFRPLGETTTPEVCAQIIRDNETQHLEKIDFVAVHGAAIVGWSFVHNLKSPEPFFGLGVADDWQGRSIGSRLMDTVLDATRACSVTVIELTVVQDNALAEAMYARRGFVRYGECRGDDGLQYYRMRLPIVHLETD